MMEIFLKIALSNNFTQVRVLAMLTSIIVVSGDTSLNTGFGSPRLGVGMRISIQISGAPDPGSILTLLPQWVWLFEETIVYIIKRNKSQDIIQCVEAFFLSLAAKKKDKRQNISLILFINSFLSNKPLKNEENVNLRCLAIKLLLDKK